MRKVILQFILIISWLINAAALLGFFLLRRRIGSPIATSNQLRFHIIRPYKTNTDYRDNIVPGNERDELHLMQKLFATAAAYGNAQVIIVTNASDPGLAKIRELAQPYGATVRVLEAPPMPPNTVSGQMFNQKVAWQAIKDEVRDEDIIVSTDCDSDLTPLLLRQVAKAYEDENVGGVGTYPLYHPAVNWSAMPLSTVINNGLGFLTLDNVVRGVHAMVGNMLSARVSVFKQYGGYEGYSRAEQMVDDMATSKKVLSTGKQLRLVGMMPVWNRYATWPDWWQRWTRWAVAMRVAVPDIFFTAPLPTYGGQTIVTGLMLYGVTRKQRRFVWPFLFNWAVNGLYASLTGIWREALFSPISAILDMVGWLYALFVRPKSLKWRGTSFSVNEGDTNERT